MKKEKGEKALWTKWGLVGVGALSLLLGCWLIWSGMQQLLASGWLASVSVTPGRLVLSHTPTQERPTQVLIATKIPAETPFPTATKVPTRTPLPTVTKVLTRTPLPTVTKMPGRTPSPVATRTPTEVAILGASPTATASPQNAPTESPAIGWPWQGRPRWGVGLAVGGILRYNTQPLRLGWYLDWSARSDPGGAGYAQMVRLRGGVLQPDAETIAAIARANPGSLWLVGNEPDVKWQDNVEPGTYARLYQQAYAVIKEADPTAQVAAGAVSQPTPLRLRYLEMALAAYQEQFGSEMPVDVWNVHNFILREERASWGVDIPLGIPDERGKLYEIEDSDNLDIFKQQIINFRRWMAQRGYQDRPLIVSEYGILMPEDYGFPPEVVVDFMIGTFDFFLTAADPGSGYPADGYRLVQRWCWYSLADTAFPAGNLFDPETGEMTAVGGKWVEYVANH